jgi:hypothetical protein
MSITENGRGFFPTLFAAFMLKNVPYSSPRGSNFLAGGYNPEFHPQRKKFKGFQREINIGRRRSRFYFNKNR